jgi:hypothetical protein
MCMCIGNTCVSTWSKMGHTSQYTQYEPLWYQDKSSYAMNMTTIWYEDDHNPPQKQPIYANIATIYPNIFQLLLQNGPNETIWFHSVFGLKGSSIELIECVCVNMCSHCHAHVEHCQRLGRDAAACFQSAVADLRHDEFDMTRSHLESDAQCEILLWNENRVKHTTHT